MTEQEFKPVTDLQRRFIEEYLIYFSVPKTCDALGISHTTGYAFMKDPRIAAGIYDGKHRVTARANISADQVLEQLDTLSKVDVTDAIEAVLTAKNNDELVTNIKALPDNVKFAIKAFKIGRNGPEIQFHDKVAAITNLGRYFKLFTDKVESTDRQTGLFEVIHSEMTPQQAQEAYEKTLKGE